MSSAAPAARVSFVVESISGLQRLQREMARVSQRDENYGSKKRALQAAIQELRKMISANADDGDPQKIQVAGMPLPTDDEVSAVGFAKDLGNKAKLLPIG